MTSAMSNAILEYAKLAGQLDCKTNQQLNKIAGTSKGQTKQSAATAPSNRRKREFASLDEIESKGNLQDIEAGKPVENGLPDASDGKVPAEKSDEKQEDGENVIKEKGNLETAKTADRKGSLSGGAKLRPTDGDIGKLSEQLDNLESDLQLKTKSEANEPLENGVPNGVPNGEDEERMPSGEPHSAGGRVNEEDEKLVNGLPNGDLTNGYCLEEDDEYLAKTEDAKDAGEQTDFNSFYDSNRLNDNRATGKYRPSSKRLIRSRSKEFGQPYPAGSLNNQSSSSSSPNDGSLQSNTAAPSTTAASSGNDSYTFEDNLADENRCSSTTSINSNNGLAGGFHFNLP